MLALHVASIACCAWMKNSSTWVSMLYSCYSGLRGLKSNGLEMFAAYPLRDFQEECSRPRCLVEDLSVDLEQGSVTMLLGFVTRSWAFYPLNLSSLPRNEVIEGCSWTCISHNPIKLAGLKNVYTRDDQKVTKDMAWLQNHRFCNGTYLYTL